MATVRYSQHHTWAKWKGEESGRPPKSKNKTGKNYFFQFLLASPANSPLAQPRLRMCVHHSHSMITITANPTQLRRFLTNDCASVGSDWLCRGSLLYNEGVNMTIGLINQALIIDRKCQTIVKLLVDA